MKDIVKRIVKGVSSLYRMERINVSQQDMKDRHSMSMLGYNRRGSRWNN